MFWTISVILMLIWGWGFITGATGGMIHLLLIAAAATALMGILLSGRRNAF